MTRATDSRPCPTPTTIAPPAASRYARPSASQIVEPSARTATGSEGSTDRRKTLLTAGDHRAGNALAGHRAYDRSRLLRHACRPPRDRAAALSRDSAVA